MFDPKSGELRKQQVILIEGTRIAQVGSAQEVQIPPGAETLDFSNATVLPGLIDGHTHVFASGPELDEQMMKESLQYRELEALVNSQRDLYVGFTTLRDLKTLGGMYGDVDLRTAINGGLVQGPPAASLGTRVSVDRRFPSQGILARSGFAFDARDRGFALGGAQRGSRAALQRRGLDQVLRHERF